MLILGLDSTAVSASAAVAEIDDGGLRTYSVFSVKNKMTHSENLLPMVDDVLKAYCSYVSMQFTPVVNADAGHFRYFGFYKALFDFLIAPPSVEPDIIFVGQNVMTDRYEVIFRYSKNYQKMMRLTPQAYEAYYACARGGMPTDAYNHLRSAFR